MSEEKKSSKHPSIELPCCPNLIEAPCSDHRLFRYKLPFRPFINGQRIPVDVIFVFEYSRCTDGLTQGDLQHTISLLPSETVRLFTVDKASRWSFDKETSLSYRHERTSAESQMSFGFANAVSDLTISENTRIENEFDESWAEGGGGASVNLGIIEIGGGGGGGGHSGESSYDFTRNLSRHAEASSSYVAASVRASRAVSIGEVETREHAEGESEQHFESATRRISNENQCHVVNYFVWQLMKVQRIKWRIAAIEIRVNDSATPTTVTNNTRIDTKLSVVPQSILATDNISKIITPGTQNTSISSLLEQRSSPRISQLSTLDNDLRIAATAAVKADLEKVGMLNDDGTPTGRIIAELSWERTELLPTGGLVVKGCLDPCSVCEPFREKEIKLKIRRMELENELYQKQIDLLEKHKDYRCCPAGEEEPTLSM